MPSLITSTSNQIIKQVRKLQKSKERKNSGLFYLEGIRLVGEAIQNKAKLETLIFCRELLRSNYGLELIQACEENKECSLLDVSKNVFESFASKENPQGIAAIAEQKWSSIDALTTECGVWSGLVDIQDPGNLGSILRSSDGAGGRGIILIGQTTDPYHPTAVRASMGAIFTQEIIHLEIQRFIEWAKAVVIPLIGTVCGPAEHYKKYNYPENMVLLLGSEQKGLSSELQEICENRVQIPMNGSMDSLNLSNAASIILFEIAYQQRNR